MSTIPTIQINREEECLRAIILNSSAFMPTPVTRKEEYYKAIADGVTTNLITPVTREEEYLYAIALKSVDVKEPINREEIYLYNWAKGTHNTPVPITRKEIYLDYICNANLSTTLKIDMFTTNVTTPQNVGSLIKISAIGTGSGDVTYRFVAQYGTYKVILQNFNTNNTVNWIPDKDGTYTIYLRATDSTGQVIEKQITQYIIK